MWLRYSLLVLGILFNVLLATGCSTTPTVHVFSHYLSEEERNKVVNALDKHEFQVEVSVIAPPENISQNTIVYTPLNDSQMLINQLITVLSGNGYEISSANLIFSGNHSFSENNLGVYLFPEGFIEPTMQYNIPFHSEYVGDNCQYSNTLNVKADRTFTLLVDRWNEVENRYDEQRYQGYWSRDSEDTFQLRFNDKSRLYFNRSIRIESDRNGMRKRVRLSPVKSSGNFILETIKCSYSIALVL